MLAEQVEQRGFERGDRVDRGAQVERLQAAAAHVAIGKGAPHVVEHRVVVADRLADDERARILERAADAFAARHFADAGPARAVLQDHEVAGEERTVRAAQVEQHAVVAGDRNGLQLDDARRVVGRRGSDGVHGGDGERVGDAVRQNLCRARREVRSFDNRRARRASPACRQQPERAGATSSMPISRASAKVGRSRTTGPSRRRCARLGQQEIRVAIISRRMTCDAV